MATERICDACEEPILPDEEALYHEDIRIWVHAEPCTEPIAVIPVTNLAAFIERN